MTINRCLIAKNDIKKGEEAAQLWPSHNFENIEEYDKSYLRFIESLVKYLKNEITYEKLKAIVEDIIEESEKRGAYSLFNYMTEDPDGEFNWKDK